MKKLRLDDLRVDTFATGPAPGSEGTVRAHGGGPSFDEPCEPLPPDYTETCPPYTQGATCYASCNGSCADSCYGSCFNTCYTCWQNTCEHSTCYPCYPQGPTD